MAIQRGRDWGGTGPLAPDGVVVPDDAAARAVVEAARRAGTPLPELGLLGGDLCRTLGGRGDEARLRSDAATRLQVDVGAALVDGRLHWFVAHLVARRSWWRGRVVAVMNAEHLGRWDVAPRAHPGDGRFDLLEVAPGALGLRDRLAARGRLPSGAHVPHPAIVERRVAAWQAHFEPALDVWLDGTPIGRCRDLSVRVEPEVLTVVV